MSNQYQKSPKLDAFHKHEFKDRAWMAYQTVEMSLGEHPVLKTNEKIAKRLKKVQKQLWKLYKESALYELPGSGSEAK